MRASNTVWAQLPLHYTSSSGHHGRDATSLIRQYAGIRALQILGDAVGSWKHWRVQVGPRWTIDNQEMLALVDECMDQQKSLQKVVTECENPNLMMKEVFTLIKDESGFGFDADAAAGTWLMLPALLTQ